MDERQGVGRLHAFLGALGESLFPAHSVVGRFQFLVVPNYKLSSFVSLLVVIEDSSQLLEVHFLHLQSQQCDMNFSSVHLSDLLITIFNF